MNNVNIDAAIAAAKCDLLTKSNPFFGFLVSKLEFIEIDDANFRTAATDGRRLYFCRDFVAALPHDQRVFLLAHEVMHCVFDTMGRRGTKDHEWWNQASDYCINGMLVEQGIGKVIPGILLDKRFDGMSSDEIYNILMAEDAPKRQTLDVHMAPAPGASGDQQDKDGQGLPVISEQEAQEISGELKNAIIDAVQKTRIQGASLGGTLQEFVDELVNPRINWRQMLSATVKSLFNNDMSWSKRRTRNLPGSRFILPSMVQDETVDIAVALDTSGSISEDQRREFLSEICGIMQYFNNFSLHLWCFDTAVHAHQRFTPSNIQELMQYRAAGGGGTEIGCNWHYMKKHEIKPNQLVVLTDAYNGGSDWGDANYCETLWLVHSNRNPDVPFGKLVDFDVARGN